MARIEVIMPQMGESIVEGTILKWHKKVGDTVKKDETLLEIGTDKVDSEIPSPASGVLAEIVAAEQSTVPVKTVIAYLESESASAQVSPSQGPPSQAARHAESPAAPPKTAPKPTANRFYSPLVMNIAQTEGVSMTELEGIEGTGDKGRVTKRDILGYVEARKSSTTVPAKPVPEPPPVEKPAAQAPRPPAPMTEPAPAPAPDLKVKYPEPDFEIVQMSNVLQKMAQHMLASIRTSPHVAAVHEVDMTAVVRHRQEHAVEFEKKNGFKLTFTPYIADAVVKALKKYPMLNSSVEGDKIIKKHVINLGLAVAADNGLIVPVIKHAEKKNFTDLARSVNEVVNRTRMKKLTPDDIQGGSFTISNYGVFGTTFGTPLINQPQVAILGTGAITKRPVVVDDAIAIRSIAFFTLSFDHRIIDGAMGGMFMEALVDSLERIDVEMKI